MAGLYSTEYPKVLHTKHNEALHDNIIMYNLIKNKLYNVKDYKVEDICAMIFLNSKW